MDIRRFYAIRVALLLICSWMGIGSNGQATTWRRSFGGFGSDDGRCVRQTSDGGYVIVGSTGSFGMGGDIYVVRADPNGAPLWTRTYGANGVDQGVAVEELTDGFVFAGSTSSGNFGGYDMVLIRTDGFGDVLWQKYYGTPEWDLCYDMEVLPDGFVLGGVSYGLGSPLGEAFVVRTDLVGDTLWTMGVPNNGGSLCSGLAVAPDGSTYLAGSSKAAAGDDDGFVAKVNGSGSLEWVVTVGGDSLDYFSAVTNATTGGCVAVGGTKSGVVAQRVFLAYVTDSGSVGWQNSFGNTVDAGGADIYPAHDSGYVLTGFNSLNLGGRDMIFTLVDENGYFVAGYDYGAGERADGYSVRPTDDGGYVATGWCEGYGPGTRAMYVVKADSIGHTADLLVQTYQDPLSTLENGPILSQAMRYFPNPVGDERQLTLNVSLDRSAALRLYDALGNQCLTTRVDHGVNQLSLTGFSSGFYTVELERDGQSLGRGKLLLLD